MSGSPGLSGSARPVTAAQKSAEGIVAGSPAKARTTDRVSRTATLMRTKRQNIQLELALEPAAKGEARSAGAQGTEARTARAEPERPATPSNRRVRPRTHGGVGGEEPRGSPLSRLRSGPSDDCRGRPCGKPLRASRKAGPQSTACKCDACDPLRCRGAPSTPSGRDHVHLPGRERRPRASRHQELRPRIRLR